MATSWLNLDALDVRPKRPVSTIGVRAALAKAKNITPFINDYVSRNATSFNPTIGYPRPFSIINSSFTFEEPFQNHVLKEPLLTKVRIWLTGLQKQILSAHRLT